MPLSSVRFRRNPTNFLAAKVQFLQAAFADINIAKDSSVYYWLDRHKSGCGYGIQVSRPLAKVSSDYQADVPTKKGRFSLAFLYQMQILATEKL